MLLLYDIAMQLSRWDKVCVFHFGSHEKELEQLDDSFSVTESKFTDLMEHIERASELGTTKSTTYENMNNMIAQIGPLLKDYKQ